MKALRQVNGWAMAAGGSAPSGSGHPCLSASRATEPTCAEQDAHAIAPPTAVRTSFETPITDLLERAAAGDASAIHVLLPRIYATLRRLAHRQRLGEGAHTLETTALVHEAYLQLAGKREVSFADRAHLYGYMSQVMRHLLVDRARRHRAQKRQAPERVEEQASDVLDVLAIDEAMTRLAALDARLARVAELRMFADLSSAEIAGMLGVHARTIERDWLKARTFLSACLAPAR